MTITCKQYFIFTLFTNDVTISLLHRYKFNMRKLIGIIKYLLMLLVQIYIASKNLYAFSSLTI